MSEVNEMNKVNEMNVENYIAHTESQNKADRCIIGFTLVKISAVNETRLPRDFGWRHSLR